MYRKQIVAFAILVATAFALRHATFGNPTLEPDESFYLLVGIKMHQGLLPYVDIYDRKPFGLFALYYLIAAVTEHPAGYQVFATIFAGLTACVIYLFRQDRFGILAGILYLAGLNLMFGNGGQAPVFYNLFIAVAAWLVANGRHVFVAMLLCGIAITIKHSAVFESIWLGLYAAKAMRWRQVPIMIGLGALPFALTTLPFLDDLPLFWAAVIEAPLSNAAKSPSLILLRLIEAFPILLPGLAGFLLAGRRLFLGGWLVATMISFVAIPNYFPHYFLPAMVPLAILASELRWGVAPFIAIAIVMKWPFDYDRTRRARAEFDRLDRALAMQRGTLAVRTGPVLLYRHRPMPRNVWEPSGDLSVDRCERADYLYMPRQQTIGVCITRSPGRHPG